MNPSLPSRATLLRWGSSAVRLLPDGWVRRAACVIGDAAWLADRGRRRAVLENLARLAPELDPLTRRRKGRATFRNLAYCTVDLLKLRHLAPQGVRALAHLDGLDRLRDDLRSGRGAIIVTAHLGHWELGAALLASLGFMVHAVAERLPHGSFEAYGQMRQAAGVSVIPLDTAPRAMIEVLGRGEILLLVADRVIAGSGIVVPFGKYWRRLPYGPAALSLRYGVPLFGGYLVRSDSDHPYRGRLEPIARQNPAGVESLTADIGRWIARTVIRYPDQWFVFRPEWMDAPAGVTPSRWSRGLA